MIVSIYNFFYHALPPEGELTLDELHFVVRDVWLARFDQEIEAEKTSRRKGRPRSVKEQKLEEQKLRETELYRTGIGELTANLIRVPLIIVAAAEVLDLTHPINVELFRKWDQKEAAYVQQLRFIRISSTAPETAVVSRPGHHPLLKQEAAQQKAEAEAQMDTDEVPLLLEPPSRFASTIQTMDGI